MSHCYSLIMFPHTTSPHAISNKGEGKRRQFYMLKLKGSDSSNKYERENKCKRVIMGKRCTFICFIDNLYLPVTNI